MLKLTAMGVLLTETLNFECSFNLVWTHQMGLLRVDCPSPKGKINLFAGIMAALFY